MASENGPATPGHDELECRWCDAPVGADGRCPECGRTQTRICFCGQELLPGEDPCPNCGADWQGIVKVRRRKRHRRVSALDALGYGAVGLLVALGLAALLNAVIGGLALRNETVESTELPQDLGERLGLALATIGKSLQGMSEAFSERIGGSVVLILLGLVGAVVGVVIYLHREGALTTRRRSDPRLVEVKRRRRV
ncbi:MAG: hypothetical protein KBI47_05735 [Armatimonadetes bacterium]|nr:hypothetical protein [Armatimonadota bacterium]MDI9586810.1 hypothetical protein [Acidobacteriota bacterium]